MNELRPTTGEDVCPSNDFEAGEPAGECWGDGHFACLNCQHYRADFKKHGQKLIDFAHNMQSGIIIQTLK